MYKKAALFVLCILLLSSCAPKEEEFTSGTEDGGGTGYGVSTQSLLKLSDFYFVTKSSTRENNRLSLGSPQYSVGTQDDYTLSDGSRVTLIYNEKGVLQDSTYTEADAKTAYTLFDKLALLGVVRSSTGNTSSGGQTTTTPSKPTEEKTPQGVFSTAVYRRAAFDGTLNLYLSRTSVLSAFGLPTGFTARNYRYDSYILDCYALEDGSTLMLDYGYDRTNLRAAAIRSTDGSVRTYLGTWSAQQKPGDFVRKNVTINQLTALRKGSSPQKVYETVGEPQWFEGNALDYRDAFTLSDGSVVYLVYSDHHTKLASAYRMLDNKQVTVTLR